MPEFCEALVAPLPSPGSSDARSKKTNKLNLSGNDALLLRKIFAIDGGEGSCDVFMALGDEAARLLCTVLLSENTQFQEYAARVVCGCVTDASDRGQTRELFNRLVGAGVPKALCTVLLSGTPLAQESASLVFCTWTQCFNMTTGEETEIFNRLMEDSVPKAFCQALLSTNRTAQVCACDILRDLVARDETSRPGVSLRRDQLVNDSEVLAALGQALSVETKSGWAKHVRSAALFILERLVAGTDANVGQRRDQLASNKALLIQLGADMKKAGPHHMIDSIVGQLIDVEHDSLGKRRLLVSSTMGDDVCRTAQQLSAKRAMTNGSREGCSAMSSRASASVGGGQAGGSASFFNSPPVEPPVEVEMGTAATTLHRRLGYNVFE